MAQEIAAIYAKISADVSGFEKAMNGVEGRLQSFGSSLKSGIVAGGMVAAAAITGLGVATLAYSKDAIQAASSLQETISKNNVVMGKAAESVLKWSKNSATAMGMSQTQALQAAGTFAVFGKSAGLAGDGLSVFSTEMTQLAADMASFSNTSNEEAITAIGAALRGESEPIRQYGVLLDDATLRQRAFDMGIIDSIKNALTPQQRVLAATAEIMAQTSDAQGDFARTGGNLAGQQKQLAASMENVQATIGTTLLPAFTALINAANAVAERAIPPMLDFFNTFVGPIVAEATTKLNNLATALRDLPKNANPTGTIVQALGLEDLATAINGTMSDIERLVNGWNQGVYFMRLAIDNLMITISDWQNQMQNASRGFWQMMADAAAALGKQAPKAIPWTGGGGGSGAGGGAGGFGGTGDEWKTGPQPFSIPRIPLGPAIDDATAYSDAIRGIGIEADSTATSQDRVTAAIQSADLAAGNAAAGGLSAMDKKMNDLTNTVRGVIDNAMNLGVVWDGMSGGPNGQGGDAINENAKRLAAIANEGLIGQSWLEDFKAEVPGAWADLKLLMAEGMTAQEAAQSMLGQFQAGDYMALLDKGMIKDQVKAMILGDQGAQALAAEIAGELAAEMGVSMPAALAAAQAAMGVKSTGATDSMGIEQGINGESIAASTLGKLAKGFLDKKDNFKTAGADVGTWWGEGFMAKVGDNIPPALIDVLTKLVTPAVWANIQVNQGLTAPAS